MYDPESSTLPEAEMTVLQELRDVLLALPQLQFGDA
jgi:hypothetical protein